MSDYQKPNSEIKREKGFTLVEMLVAIFIFTLTLGAIVSLFISGVRGQRNALATQRLLDQTSYSLEYMSRALRMTARPSAWRLPVSRWFKLRNYAWGFWFEIHKSFRK
jgi:prepilin-type N-terminal cleavage/methylation domain-containing protein